PDAGGGEVERCRAAQAAGADDERGGSAQPLLAFDTDLGEKDVSAVPEELLVVQFVVLFCATVGATAFTGSPLRWASACCSWKSSFEPSSTGFISAGDTGGCGLIFGAAASLGSFFSSALPLVRWRVRSASRTRVSVSVGSSTMMSGLMPSAWIERPPGV